MLYNIINTKHIHLILLIRWLCVFGIMINQPLLTATNNYITLPPPLKTDVVINGHKNVFLVLPVRFSERQSLRRSKVLRILAFAYPYLFDNIPLFYRVSFSTQIPKLFSQRSVQIHNLISKGMKLVILWFVLEMVVLSISHVVMFITGAIFTHFIALLKKVSRNVYAFYLSIWIQYRVWLFIFSVASF